MSQWTALDMGRVFTRGFVARDPWGWKRRGPEDMEALQEEQNLSPDCHQWQDVHWSHGMLSQVAQKAGSDVVSER